MTCCTSPDVNLAEEVKFRPIECDRRLCGDFSLRRTNLPANADELLRGGFARAPAQDQRVFVILGLESAPGATLRAISLLLLRRGRSTRRVFTCCIMLVGKRTVRGRCVDQIDCCSHEKWNHTSPERLAY
jgi:hypothetical protein